MTLQVRYAVRSHTGLLRTSNEDSAYAGPRLLAVADGMGGHAAGEVASAVVIAALAALDADLPGQDLLTPLRESAKTANARLRAMAEQDPSLAGMGTTLVALLFDRGRVGLLHVGDSRCYLLRDGQLTQITHDHTLVQTLVDEGRLTPEQAANHPRRSVITNVLDGRSELEPDLSVRQVRAGDRYLLCSDGLTGPVSSTETLSEALSLEDRQAACDRLVELALRGGGPDNITLVVLDVVDTDGPLPEPVVVGAASTHSAEEPGTGPAARAQLAEGRAARTPRRIEVSVSPPRRRRTAMAALLVILVVIASVFAIRVYISNQFYVGLAGQNVVVYRGVAGNIAGIDLAAVEVRTTLRAEQLPELERSRVAAGIVASDQRDAREIINRLIATACDSDASPRPRPQPSGQGTAGTAAPTPVATLAPTSPPTSPSPSPGPTLPAATPTPANAEPNSGPCP